MKPEEAIEILEKKKEYSERIIDNFLSHSRGEIKDANETIEMCDMAISALKEIRQYREIGTVKECREAVEKQKVLCESSEKYADGKCVGYGKSEMDDEPIEMCKRCKSYVGFEESEEE